MPYQPYNPGISGMASPFDDPQPYPVLPSSRANTGDSWRMLDDPSVRAGLPDSPTTTTSNKDRILKSITSPEGMAAIMSGGLGVGASLLQTNANAAEGAKNRDMLMRQLLSNATGDQLSDMTTRQQGYLNSFQQDPVHQQKQLFAAGLLRDVAGNGAAHIGPGQGVTNPVSVGADTMGFLSQDALAGNAARFYGAAGSLNPSAPAPNLAQAGFGAAGAAQQGGMQSTIDQAGQRYQQLQNQRRDELMGSMGQGQSNPGEPPGNPDPSKYHWDPIRKGFMPTEQHHNGLLSILGKVAPFAAMAIPFAGPALGMSMMAASGLSAGVGAAGALANHNATGAAQYGAGFGQDYFNRGK